MSILRKVLVVFFIILVGSGYADVKMPFALKQIADIAVKQYQASQKLQKVVENSMHHLSAQWVEVFDEKGFVIAHSHPSKIYKHKPLTQPHYNAVISVLHSGHSLMQEGPDAMFEEFYPIKLHRKTIGVIEIIKEHK